MSQGSLNPKIRFLGQKVCPVARSQTHRQTDRVTTVGTLTGFHDFFPSTYHQGSAQKTGDVSFLYSFIKTNVLGTIYGEVVIWTAVTMEVCGYNNIQLNDEETFIDFSNLSAIDGMRAKLELLMMEATSSWDADR